VLPLRQEGDVQRLLRRGGSGEEEREEKTDEAEDAGHDGS
jgi:hypothetical protein